MATKLLPCILCDQCSQLLAYQPELGTLVYVAVVKERRYHDRLELEHLGCAGLTMWYLKKVDQLPLTGS